MGEPSRPEEQPGHDPDSHGPGSQDAGGRADAREERGDQMQTQKGAYTRLTQLLECAVTELRD